MSFKASSRAQVEAGGLGGGRRSHVKPKEPILSLPDVICLPTPLGAAAEAQRDGFAVRIRAVLLRVLVLSRGCSSGLRGPWNSTQSHGS